MFEVLRGRKQDLRAIAGGADRVVVVDTETTGVYPSDRIVEIAMVTLSLDGELLDVWDTLVHPQRDVGASYVHGITPSMVANAPTFADVAGDVGVRLAGACVAAHNLPFDSRMLMAEYERIGLGLSVSCGIDTLRATGARLADACARHDVSLDGAHRALADAVATAALLHCVCSHCEPGAPVALSPVPPRAGRVLRREDTTPVQLPDPPLISYLASRLSHSGVDAAMLSYLELVDRSIADLHLDPAERTMLAALARDLGLDDAHIALAHRRFVNELVDAALADHEVTPLEYETLIRAAAALGVDQSIVESRTRDARSNSMSLAMAPGLRVVFTGDHPTLPREDLVAHARSLGLEVQSGVNKSTDLLVAADVASTSGKARKARRYGIPIIGAEEFARASGGDVVHVEGATVAERKVITCPDCLATWTVPATSSERRSKRCAECAPLASTGPQTERDLSRRS